ncbi:hypothetical protein MALV_08000 [Mycolicibacterium alvei]|uniref:Uncharacterized protein n=1 Tax=Mycolicibacterium alvei TaxID=67081 RepID=A0A6N4UP30_9MYCO|nr:hypothetical protein MALV_08000 [Mycolicibacterium alvei]
MFDGAAGAVATALTTVLEVVTATTVVDADGTTVEADSHQKVDAEIGYPEGDCGAQACASAARAEMKFCTLTP